MKTQEVAMVSDAFEAIKGLREERDRLEARLSSCQSELSAEKRKNAHNQVEINKLKARVKSLEATVKELGGNPAEKVEKDSTNSSVPPTQQSIAAKAAQRTRSLRVPSGRKSGGQPGHAGHELARTDSPARTEEHRVRICPHCGEAIPDDAEQVCTMTTQEIDLGGIGQPVVTEHRRYSAVCPHCHRQAHGKMPTGKSTKTSYGSKVQALVIYLSVVCSTPYNKIAEFMRDVFGLESFSEGTVKNIMGRDASKAEAVYIALLKYIAREKVAGMDETGVYINQMLCWFWCLQCSRFCFVFADQSRGIKALEEHGILEYIKNLVLCTDRHSTYFNLDVLTHQFCLAHLIRNLQYLCDINKEQKWAGAVQELFREAIRERKLTDPPPGEKVRARYEKRLDKLLEQDVSHYGEEFQGLQNGIIKCHDYLFTFLDHEGVPADNNESERVIRILKIKAKVSGGFRTMQGAKEFAIFHSIVETAKRNGKSKFWTLYQLVSEDKPDEAFIERTIA